MPQFYCYHCGQHIDAHAELSGWEVDCPACGGAVTVPGVLRSDPAPDAELEFDFVPLSAEPSVTGPSVEKIEDQKEPAPAPTPTPVISPAPTLVGTPAPTPAPPPPPKERHLPSAVAPEPLPEPTPPSVSPVPAAEPSVAPASTPTSEPPTPAPLTSDSTAAAPTDANPTPAPEKPPKPHWEPSRKFVPVEDPPEQHMPMTRLPSTVIFMVWMFGGALALVGIILGAGQESIIRDRCRDSMVFMLACALVVLALVGLAGLFLGMLISPFRQRKVGRMGSSFCMAVLALGLLLLGSGAFWYRSGWPWLGSSLNSMLAPFKVTPAAKTNAKSSDEDK